MTQSDGYKTKQRDHILQFLIQHQTEHVTVDDVVEYLKQTGNPVGKATVYRYMDKLVSQGDVRKYHLEDSGACFQYAANQEDCAVHFHLKCVTCKKLIHLNCNFMNGIEQHIFANHHFKVDTSKTVFYGQCEDCMKQS